MKRQRFFSVLGSLALVVAIVAALGHSSVLARINLHDGTVDNMRLGGAAGLSFPDPTPSLTRTFSPYGPSSVALAPNGRMYVAVYQEDRVYSWPNAASLFSGAAPDKTFGSANGNPDSGCTNGPSATLLCGPESLAVDSNGNLYVADTYNHRVLVFYNPDMDATPLTADFVLGQPDLNSGTANYDSNPADNIVEGFCFVRALALDSSNNLYVVDESNHRVLKFNTPLTTDILPDVVLGKSALDAVNLPCPTYDSGQTATNRLNFPLGVKLDSSGNVLVADMRNNRVLRFDAPLSNGMTAALVFSSFNFPHDVALDNSGNLYVADTLNNRVGVFTTPLTGGSTADRDFTGLNYPMGMTFDASNNFYLANCGAPAPATTYPPCVQGPSSVQRYDAPNNKTYLPLLMR